MSKYILVLLAVLLTSCGARKVNKDNTTITKDSIVESITKVITEEKKETKDSTNTKIVVEIDEIIISPIDTTKEMVVNGKVFKNAVLKAKKNKTSSLYINNKTTSETRLKDSLNVFKASEEVEIIIDKKDIDKGQDYSAILILILLILMIYTAWRTRPRL
jgi:hypothetical protein